MHDSGTIVFDSAGNTGQAAVVLLGKGGPHVVFGWSGAGLLDGEPLTRAEDEQAARGA